MTSSCPFSPEPYKLPKTRRMSNKKLRFLRQNIEKIQESSDLSILEWQRRLDGTSDKIIIKTIKMPPS